jgi:hypothetical protein
VSRIVAGFGTSAGVKENEAVPTRKPAGSAAWRSSQARCSAADAKTSEVLGIAGVYDGEPPRAAEFAPFEPGG